jgi:hypothetical protein
MRWNGRIALLGMTLVGFAFVGTGVAAVPPAEPSNPGGEARRVLEAVGAPSCVCEDERLELARYVALIAAAKDADEARERALRPSRLARKALGLARWFTPDRAQLEPARQRLTDYEARVARAQTPVDASREFEGLVRVAGDVDVRVGGGGGCHYTGAEVIAIILGFFLFIIPGIILLIVFC